MKLEVQPLVASAVLRTDSPSVVIAVDTKAQPQKSVTVLLRTEGSRVELASAFKNISEIDFYMLLRPEGAGGPFGRKETSPDAILVEVDAHDSADIDYIKKLKLVPTLAHTPIVALLDGTKHLAALGAMRAGADDVVLTPIN